MNLDKVQELLVFVCDGYVVFVGYLWFVQIVVYYLVVEGKIKEGNQVVK